MMEQNKNRKKKKKTGKIVAVLLLLAAALGAAAYWYFFLRADGTVSGTDTVVYVRSIEDILNTDGAALVSGRFSGVVEARELVKVKLDSEKTLDQTLVSVGDRVSPGTPLFTYDADKLELAYEQLKLDVEGKRGTIATYEDEIAKLEKQIKKARKPAQKAELTVQKQTAELKMKKDQYELKRLEEQTAEALAVLNDNVVRSTVSGTVRSVTPPTDNGDMGMSSSGDKSFITIVVGNDLRIAGTVSEQNVRRLAVGTEVTVRSRIDETGIRGGVIEEVNTEQALSNENNGGYYGGNNAETSAKYRFYVRLDNMKDLIVGQHVYIDLGAPGSSSSVRIPEFYLIDAGASSASVYVANAKNKIEKRTVSLGAYDAESGCYTVLSGLTLADRVAFPEETVAPGMPARDAGYAAADMPGMTDMPDMTDPSGMPGGMLLPDEGFATEGTEIAVP
ncbi:MAG: hypothetical protein Q4C53_03845 [Clostridia bacterium]|nr:hypothetical protein [Clostridia bacterium]